ncbi:inositol 2-dehydrogenase [Paenibacillus humicola]|uniref:inositol 2-dehydrogenase n=1 Tax=Paenibacillus humicola TaxID=3110540 RepID=UPI00237AC870|nr:inositol 2-dehydrogenase [Paenibacillus humicola]
MHKLGVGIIGAGRIGRLHAENLKRLGGAEIAAISDPFVEQTREWAEAGGYGRVTADYRELLADPAVEAVLICSPTDTHVEIIEEAVRARKPIFCEKPVSLSVAETARIRRLLLDTGVKFQLGFNRRFDHNMSRIRELLGEGRAGSLHMLKITSRDPAPPPAAYIKSSGGLFADMAIHDFDLARFMTGSEVEEVYVQGTVLVDPVFAECGDIDTAITTLKFRSGALGVVINSRQAHYYDQRVEAFGSEGTISIRNDTPSTAEIVTQDGARRDQPLYFFLERYKEAYVRELEAFVRAVTDGTPVPVDANDGFQAELIAYAAGISLREKRPVRLEEAAAAAGV